MVLANNMLFFDINYGEFVSITGTNLLTATAYYAYDNRSDLGNTEFVATTGELIYDFGSGTSFNVDTLIVANHNFQNFSLAVTLTNTGTWTTLTAYSSEIVNTHYYNIGSVTAIYDAKVTFTTTQDLTNGYLGEFIVTRKKFQLAYNPSQYRPIMTPQLAQNALWNGKGVYAKIAEPVFSAEIGWSNLQGSPNTLTNTDLQNVTELARRNTTFLFWPNANNTYVNMYTWRKQDIFKCKITDPVSYEFISPAVDWIISGTGFKIYEVQ